MSYTPTSTLFSQRAALVVFALTLWFVALNASGQTSTNVDTRALPANQLIERQIKGGETHSFQINLKSGQYARAEVEQRSIDVVVSLFAPDGKLVVEMDGKDGYLWRESVSCIAGNDSVTFQVKVRAYGTAEQDGNYTIRLAELRPIETKDSQRLEAEQHFYKGRKLYLQQKPDYEAAIKEYEAAAKIWTNLGDKQWQAVALINSGWTYSTSSKNELALPIIEHVASLFRETKDRVGEGKAANGIGTIYLGLSQYEKAAQFYEQALKIRREVKDKRGEGNTLYNLGFAYAGLNQNEKAIIAYEQALAIRNETKDRSGAGDALNSLGNVYYNLKQYEKAGDAFEKVLAIRREIKDRSGAGDAFNNLGNFYYDLKQYEKAISYYEQALAIKNEIKDRSGAGNELYFLGNVYFILKQYEKARDYYEQSSEVRREEGLKGYSSALLSLGYIYFNLKQYEKAKERLKQALDIAKASNDRNRQDNASLGLKLVSSPPITSSPQALAVNSTDDGWPLPPLVKGDWIPLDKQESQEMIERLVTSASTPDTAFIEAGARRITKFRAIQLSFYPGAKLYEGLVPDVDAGAVFTFILLKDGTIKFLNGTSPPIHDLNAKLPIQLNNRERVEFYLRFFTTAIWGEYGNFRIVDGIEDPLWARDASESDRQRAAKYIRPLALDQVNNERWRASATVWYSNALFSSILYIEPTGMVEMRSDVAVAPNLPLRRQKFSGPLRYEVGIYR